MSAFSAGSILTESVGASKKNRIRKDKKCGEQSMAKSSQNGPGKGRAFRLNIEDWDLKARHLDLMSRAIWYEILIRLHWLARDGAPIRFGYLEFTDRTPWTAKYIARLTGGSPRQVTKALDELQRGGILRRDESGVLYCPELVGRGTSQGSATAGKAVA